MALPDEAPKPEEANRSDRAGDILDGLMDAFEALLNKEEPTAAELNTIRQFLKDNGISTTNAPGSRARKLGSLVKLPYDEENEDSAEPTS